MHREYVLSSSIRFIAYDEERAILEVQFRRGPIYRYYNVPAAIFRDLQTAPSKGRYMNAHIRTEFPFRRIN